MVELPFQEKSSSFVSVGRCESIFDCAASRYCLTVLLFRRSVFCTSVSGTGDPGTKMTADLFLKQPVKSG